MYEVF